MDAASFVAPPLADNTDSSFIFFPTLHQVFPNGLFFPHLRHIWSSSLRPMMTRNKKKKRPAQKVRAMSRPIAFTSADRAGFMFNPREKQHYTERQDPNSPEE